MRLLTSTFFKSTDRNSYILVDSCHYGPWLRAVPKSQYMRLKLNCTSKDKFLIQTDVLTSRFVEKGYSRDSLKNTQEEVICMHRRELLREKSLQGGSMSGSVVPFITTISVQHMNVKKMMRKQHILKNDQIFNPVLPDKPQVVYRGAPSLRHTVTPNILNPPSIKTSFFQNLTGFFQCKRCPVCSISGCLHRTQRSTSTTTEFEIKPFITCSTEEVVYLLQCPFGLQYVGRTKRSHSKLD